MRISDWSSDVVLFRSYLLASLAAATSLSACGSGGEKLDQTGKNPKLPKIDETPVPPMKNAKTQGWNGETPTVPAGFPITAVATDPKIPAPIPVRSHGRSEERRGGHEGGGTGRNRWTPAM